MTDFLSKTSRVIGVVGAVALMGMMTAAGCTEVPGDPCKGGVINASTGACEAKCDPSKCLEGNVCAANRCAPLCDTHNDCVLGFESCQATVDDTTGGTIQACLPTGDRPVPDANGYAAGYFGAPCPFGNDQCSMATACPNGLSCDLNACADCTLDEVACDGKEPCNIGQCGDGSACTFNTCETNECTPFFCLSAGDGDGTGYCTHHDCQSDDQCPEGFYCGASRLPNEICGVSMKGNNGICGNTLEECIDPSAFSANGATMFEDELCLMRRTCVKAERCASCETNLDCSIGDGDICHDTGGAAGKICAKTCEDDTQCRHDYSCVPSSPSCSAHPRVPCTADEECPDFASGETCIARNACTPKAGICQGAGFCDPCLDDSDCGDGLICGSEGCYDPYFSTSCDTDADCPVAPSGANGECLDEDNGYTSNLSVYKKCFIPYNAVDDRFTCWP